MKTMPRRLFLALAPSAGLGAFVAARAADTPTGEPAPASPSPVPVGDAFPAYPPELVRETVGVSHGNFARVRELVERHPSLAKATRDWGFGDFESAIDAASHVGNREIAEYLMSKGARETLFTAAMLGKLDVVRAFVTAIPGIQRKTGPHSLTLLHRARRLVRVLSRGSARGAHPFRGGRGEGDDPDRARSRRRARGAPRRPKVVTPRVPSSRRSRPARAGGPRGTSA